MKKELLFFILVGVFFLRVPFLFEPYWYRDEGVYLTIGQSLANGAVMYKDISDYPAKTPFIYWLAGLVKGNQYWMRMVVMGWVMVTIMCFWLLAARLSNNNTQFQVLTTIVFGLMMSWPRLEGNTVNSEIFFLGFNLLAMVGLAGKDVGWRRIFAAGVLVGLASNFKFQACIELLVWPIIWWWGGARQYWHRVGWLGLGWVAAVGAGWMWLNSLGAGREYLWAATVGNLGYVDPSYAAKLVAVAAGVGLGLWWVREKLTGSGLVWIVWAWVSLVAAMLSGHPYPHYLLQTTAAMAIGVGFLLLSKGWAQKAAVGLFLVAGMVWYYGGYYKYSTIEYYDNFFAWISGNKSEQEYREWFGPQVKENYDLAKFIMAGSDKNDQIYVWGDDAMIYALARRQSAYKYVVRFEVVSLGRQSEMVETIENKLPKYVVMQNGWGDGGLAGILEARYVLEKKVGGSKLYRRVGYN
jgi:hypothetical protein